MNLKLKLRIIECYHTQERFALAAKINESTVSKIVRGVLVPTRKQKERIEETLKTSIEELDLEQGYYVD